MENVMKQIFAGIIIALIVLLGIGNITSKAFSFSPPEKLSPEFLQGTWTNTQHGVNYGFMGKNTMLISDSIEGEEYHYIIKDDTIIFRMLLDEELGYTEYDTMTYKIINENEIDLFYQRLKFKLIRNTP